MIVTNVLNRNPPDTVILNGVTDSKEQYYTHASLLTEDSAYFRFAMAYTPVGWAQTMGLWTPRPTPRNVIELYLRWLYTGEYHVEPFRGRSASEI